MAEQVPSAENDLVVRALRKELAFLGRSGHYRVLGIALGASETEIWAAFERFKRKWHPTRLSDDATTEMRALASEIYALGCTAFEVLTDPERRAAYIAPRTLLPRNKAQGVKPAAAPRALPPPPPDSASPAEALATPVESAPVLSEPPSAPRLAVVELPPPDDEDEHLRTARTLLREGQPQAARQALERVLTLRPGSRPGRALAHVAAALEQAIADEATSEQEIEQALAEDPDCVEALAVREELAARREAVIDRILPERVSRRTVIEAVVLAFSSSRLRDLVGTDALRSVLEARYIQMVGTPGQLDLEPLWEILTAQPGFVPALAIPPLARIKLWESRLSVTVMLPRGVGELSLLERDRQAAECRVSEEALTRAIEAQAPSAPTPRAPLGAAGSVVVTATETVAARKRRGLATYLLLATVLMAVGSGLYTFGGSQVRSLSPSDLSQEIPAVEARQSGAVIGLVLGDDAWISRPEPERRRQLEQALARARAQTASGIIIMDHEGRIRASASLAAGGGEPVITFTP
jgi:curved DNA-binding protein CbpA